MRAIFVFRACIRFFHQSHNTVHFGGLFALKQWISSSLKHDTVPRVINLYCFYVKIPSKRIALWDGENSQFRISYSNCTQVLTRYFVTYLNINSNVQPLNAHLQLKMR